MQAYGLKWLFVSKKYDADLAGLAALDGSVLTRRYENENYVVYKINDSSAD